MLTKLTRLFIVSLIAAATLSGCATASGGVESQEKIVFADAGWDSIRVHNQIARLILEKGYGKETDVINGSTTVTFVGLKEGDIDVYMEAWTNNIQKMYSEALEEGAIKEVSTNYKTQKQGLFVPTYVIEGDPERGIEPMAPGLDSVKELPKYWKVFRSPTDRDQGRIVGSPSIWEGVDQILRQKMETYGLKKTYNYFQPGSAAGLSASFEKAYKAGEPWVGYYWGPTWLTAKYDVTLLDEPEFHLKVWKKNKGTEWIPVKVTIAVNSELPEKAPKVVEFLSRYQTSADLTNKILAYMQKNGATPREAAKWFIEQYPEVWTKWVPEEVAQKVKKN